MPSWVVPSDSHSAGDTGHTTDHNHVADDLTLIATAFPGVTTGVAETAHNTLDDGTGAMTVTSDATFTGSGSGTTGAVQADCVTLYPNAGIGSGSASMFLDNQGGQVWEFFNSAGGLWGIWDKTANKAAVEVAPSTELASFFGAVDVATVGKGLQVAEGSNAKQGTATLNGTTSVVVSNTSVTASSRIFLTIQSRGSVNPPGSPYVVTRTAGTSFSIASTVASDNSVVAYQIFEPG